ncbi:MAG TPA: vanadium-dependent haloperoxidase [Gaiellaceae bacterium]|nr:vanadium-dependent haloperoxidase [Gaiellaceae bacterium]
MTIALRRRDGTTRARALRVAAIPVMALVIAGVAGTAREAAAALPPGNTVAQWNKIAEDTVVGSGAFQAEGFVYMAYVSAAVYDAAVAIHGGFEPYGPAITAPAGASSDAAVVEAAYQTLVNYFPSQAGTLGALYTEALGLIPDRPAKSDGQAVGLAAATNIITLRSGDGRMTPIGVTSSFPTLPPGPGVWRLTPPFAAPQTPWVGNVRAFVLQSLDQFLPDPPPLLQSDEWVEAFDEIKAYGAATGGVRSDEQTAVARFWSANVIRQYNRAARDVAAARGLSLLATARLAAMVNVVGADALMSALQAKYHYLFWRPVTAIDPTAVTADGFGPVPGYDDGNAATVEQTGWRPLLTTPNHPEYPAAHGVITSAMAEVFSTFLGTNQIDLDIHGFDATGPAGNLNAVRHFDMPNDLRHEIVDARVWAGLHYRFSGVAGVVPGRKVAAYDLRHAFQPIG